jgi:hypothetical protein
MFIDDIDEIEKNHSGCPTNVYKNCELKLTGYSYAK